MALKVSRLRFLNKFDELKFFCLFIFSAETGQPLLNHIRNRL